MASKKALSSVVGIAVLSLVSCVKSDGGFDFDTTLGIIMTIVILTLPVYFAGRKKRRKDGSELTEEQSRQLEEIFADARRIRKEDSDERWEILRKQYGEPDSILSIDGTDDYISNIIVYDEKRTVVLDGTTYAFKDVLGYSVKDDAITLEGDTVAESHADIGSVIGRSLVGNALAGKTGAIIGGTTASRRTRYTHTSDEVIHDYSVLVSVNNLQEPIVSIHVDEDEVFLRKVTSLLDIIIKKGEMASQPVAQSGGVADELLKLAKLKEQGVLTEGEFAAQKAKLLGGK